MVEAVDRSQLLRATVGVVELSDVSLSHHDVTSTVNEKERDLGEEVKVHFEVNCENVLPDHIRNLLFHQV